MAAGLAGGVITPTDKMYCEKGTLRVDNVTIRDTHPAEWLTISQVLAVSSVRGEYWARPKSSTFTRRLSVTITFEDFTSRWTTPRSWASASASAT